jgi:hypothetical protein
MSNKDWQGLRNEFIRTTHDTPGGMLEDQLIRAYEENPAAVERAVEKIQVAFEAGRIRSPWGALRAEVAKAMAAGRNPTHDQGSSRQKAITRAEQWIRTAGLHFDRESEIEQELFGSASVDLDRDGNPIVSAGNSILGEFANDADLRSRMVGLWRSLRPVGERVEADQAERLGRWKAQREEAEAGARLARKLAEAAQEGVNEAPAEVSA